MKALVLAGGRGKRLGELTKTTNKCMLEINGLPVIEYNLKRASDIPEINEIIVVVGHRAEDIINRYGTFFNGKKIRYVIQWEQKGLVHAIECAKDAIGNDDFFLLLGDEVLVNSRHVAMYREFKEKNYFAVCGVLVQKEIDRIKRTYTVITDESGRIYRLIEKPKKPLNTYQGTGHCIFKNAILSYLERTPIHPERNEKELPDLIQCAVDDGMRVYIYNICDYYSNINTEEDIKDVEEFMNKK
ncbi:MAG: nucleotidyltransferase family protein [Thermoplasmata archaeon]